MTALWVLIPILVVAAAVLFIVSARRGDARRGAGALSRETVKRDRSDLAASGAAPEPVTGREIERLADEERAGTLVLAPAPAIEQYVPPADPETVGVTRRQFLNRSSVALMTVSLAGFGAACVAFLWPKLSGGFGSKINAGNINDLKTQIRANNNFLYLPEGRAWLTEYPKEGLPKAEAVYPANVLTGMEAGITALYQKCPHLGCRVPECASSQWFECPCHGSQYNRNGEKKAGPAPRSPTTPQNRQTPSQKRSGCSRDH